MGLDAQLFSFLNAAGDVSPFVDPWMRAASDHSWAILGVLVAVALARGRRPWRRRLALVPMIALAVALADRSGNLLKKRFERTRPCAVIADARIATHCPESPSFPSNHAANAFAVAVLVAASDRRLGWAVLGAAAFIGHSRIHVGVHYPGDVAAGALLGSIAALAVIVLARSLRGKESPDLLGAEHVRDDLGARAPAEMPEPDVDLLGTGAPSRRIEV